MKLDITKQHGSYKITSPGLDLFSYHHHLPMALSHFGQLLEEYYQSLKIREAKFAPNLKQELEEIFGG